MTESMHLLQNLPRFGRTLIVRSPTYQVSRFQQGIVFPSARRMTTRTENTRLTVATAGKVEGVQKIGDPNLPIAARGDDFCRTEFQSLENKDAVVSYIFFLLC